MSKNNFLNPPTIHTPNGYTQVVETFGGRTIYISGQIALNPEGNLIGKGDFEVQIRQVFKNLKAAVESVGGTFEDIVKLNFYLVDPGDIPHARTVRDEFVNTEKPPASTAVIVKQLFSEDFLVEVEAVAVISG